MPQNDVQKANKASNLKSREWFKDFYYYKKKEESEIQNLVKHYTKIKNMEGISW